MGSWQTSKSIGQADKLEIQVRVDVAVRCLKSTKQALRLEAQAAYHAAVVLKNNFIYLFILAMLGLRCYEGFSLAAVRRGFLSLQGEGRFSLVVVQQTSHRSGFLLRARALRLAGFSSCGRLISVVLVAGSRAEAR